MLFVRAANPPTLVLWIWGKPRSRASGIPSNPQTTVVQSDPIVEDIPADKSGETLADQQKEVELEKTTFATDGKNMPP